MKNDTLRMEQRQDGVTAGGQAMRRYSCEDLNRGKNPVMQSWWRNVPGTGRGKSHGSDGEVGSVRGSSSTKLQSDSSAQSLSRVRLFVTPWTAARQASLSITNPQSLLKLMSTELVMPSNHLILCRPLLLLPSIFPSIRVFSNKSALHIRWPKYWSFSISISPSNEHQD